MADPNVSNPFHCLLPAQFCDTPFPALRDLTFSVTAFAVPVRGGVSGGRLSGGGNRDDAPGSFSGRVYGSHGQNGAPIAIQIVMIQPRLSTIYQCSA